MPLHQQLITQYKLLKPQLINSLKEIISIPSILKESESSSTPFGYEIDKCLNKTLEICQHLGFTTHKDSAGYYGYADIGEGTELIGVLCHLDVVPVEDPENWYADPFTLYQKENLLIARGISDDKGPSLICLYALKALLNTGFKLQKRIRFIFGTDEENLWRCINKYVKYEELPYMGITPDADFPVINIEKGLLQFSLEGIGENITIKGGNSFNAVPNSITYTGPRQDELQQELTLRGYKFKLCDNGIIIEGKTVHAQSTEQGINPIARLIICLYALNIHSPSIDFIAQMIQENPYGELLLNNIEDEISGKLKTNLAKIDINEKKAQIFFDFRIPISYSIDDLISKISEKAFTFGLTFRLFDRLDPLYIAEDTPLIQTLCDIYSQETNLPAKPIAIGGATYSRAIKNFASFGMNFPHSPKTAHQTNECITIKDMNTAFIIYAKTFAKLNNL